MNALRLALLALACSLPLAAAAQWQWLDKDGRKVFSDRAPPPEIAPSRILRQPGVRPPAVATTAPAAAPALAAPLLPKPSGQDKALEEKRKQLEAAEAQKKKAEEERLAAARADNCSRAKASKATYDSGVRIARTNSQGEREFIDDQQRAAETERLQGIIARDCS